RTQVQGKRSRHAGWPPAPARTLNHVPQKRGIPIRFRQTENRSNKDLGVGYTPWQDVFGRLKELRKWGPEDRISPEDKGVLEEIAEDLSEDESVRIEVELVYRPKKQEASNAQTSFEDRLRERGGRLITSQRIGPISYHGLLVEIPASELKAILSQEETSLRGANEVMHIRPQSLGNGIGTTDITAADFPARAAADRPPILALLDGAVVSGHPLLVGRTDGIDLFALEERTPVRDRKHGTAMASLIVHGDLNSPGSSPLPRRIITVPVMEFDGREECLPTERLAIDLVYEAVLHLRQQTDADILIINLSLGNKRRPFHGQMSPWARLLDWLAWEHGILFVIAAGNDDGFITIEGYPTGTALENDKSDNRPKAVLRAVDARKAERRILSRVCQEFCVRASPRDVAFSRQRADG
uniref:S8 family serine peptidase n=1 Tax=Oleisolibacter albus TaxID=2171757 RepID=UPI00196101BC